MNQLYEIIEKRHLTDLGAEGTLLKHKKSGARLFLVSNNDENKVFSIGFRTPPVDSTGLTHILEHSVLCGSKEFPIKDPFVELAKGSMNTFLNAMTYPDKTVYPVASCNDKDFRNLMHVYLDAVFYPNIYNREEIFKQEGWHYELENAEDDLKINGVVYNEMKGAFSSPESMLEREILNSLFPDTPYGFESGGDPQVIPELTYEKFLDFHRTYYHPSNSFIYLYGDMDMEEQLSWMDAHYLSKFDAIEIDTTLPEQSAFAAPIRVEKPYPITEDEDTDHKAYLSANYVCGTSDDKIKYTALEILEYALIHAPGAPLKQALIDAGIGEDIMGSVDNGLRQMIFSVIAKNVAEEDEDTFRKILNDTLTELSEGGLSHRTLLAGINSFEFRYREADFGRFPIGLSYGLQSLDSWLYDENDPFMHLEEGETFAYLRKAVEEDYFENLIKECLLGNPHASVVMIRPKQGMIAENDQALKDKLAAYKASLSDEEIEALVEDTKHLKEYQSTPSTREELETIPLLELSDISEEITPIMNRLEQAGQTKVLFHDIETRGIAYPELVFDADALPMEEMGYLSLLSTVIGYVDTENYTYRELADEINIHTGGIGSRVSVFTDQENEGLVHTKFIVSAKSLFDEIPKTFELIREMLLTSDLKNEKRLKEILTEARSRQQMAVNMAGHSMASMRGMSYFSESARRIDESSGVAYYDFLIDLTDHFDEKKQQMIENLESLCDRLFTKEGLLVSMTAKGEDENAFVQEVEALSAQLYDTIPEDKETDEGCTKKNEGFKTASQVNYVARCGNFKKAGYQYHGALKILKTIMAYDYLWNNIRVLGGAYGCMSDFSRDGDSYLVSYRDPHLTRTIGIYEQIPQYLETFEADERDMLKFIIGTISSMDTPLNPFAAGSRSLSIYLTSLKEETLRRERKEVLSATAEDIRRLAPLVQAVLDDDCICVVGEENKVSENEELFLQTRTLL